MANLRYPLVLCFIVVLLFGGVPLLGPQHPAAAWLAAALLLIAFVMVAGYSVTGRWIGALIDDRNVVSLSRLQMALWTCLVLSALITAGLLNLAHDATTALSVEVPLELWALMGISTTSLVGSPLILATKATKPANAAETQRTLDLLSREDATLSAAKGQLIVNCDISGARWSDMFTGEEVANAAHLDLTRIQMFFFTIVTAVCYGASLLWTFWGASAVGIHKLPDLGQSIVALIGISHTGYLVAKAVPRSQDAAPGTAGAMPLVAEGAVDPHPPMG